MPRLIFALPLFLALCACSSAQNQSYPALVPAENLLLEEPLTPSPAPALEARAAALKARAARLRTATP